MRQEVDIWLPSNAQDGNRVLIYFAGHAMLTDYKR